MAWNRNWSEVGSTDSRYSKLTIFIIPPAAECAIEIPNAGVESSSRDLNDIGANSLYGDGG